MGSTDRGDRTSTLQPASRGTEWEFCFLLTFVQIIDKITGFLKLWEANNLSFNSFKLWKTDVKQNKKMTWKNSLYLDIL